MQKKRIGSKGRFKMIERICFNREDLEGIMTLLEEANNNILSKPFLAQVSLEKAINLLREEGKEE